MGFCWYVAQTHPLREVTARFRLRRQEFSVYLPFETVRKVVQGQMVERQLPLFPSYLFVQLDLEDDPDQRWKQVNSTRAVLSLLPSGERPEPIRDVEVERLQDFESQGFFKRGAVKPGERVRVWRGMLADQVLHCLSSKGERLQCLWHCLGAERVVNLRLSDVLVLH